jgi:hypothetical protein
LLGYVDADGHILTCSWKAIVVVPGHPSLLSHPINRLYRQRKFGFPDVIEVEFVLGGHGLVKRIIMREDLRLRETHYLRHYAAVVPPRPPLEGETKPAE